MKPRKIKLIKATITKKWCGPACLRMAYEYLNPSSKTNIRKIAKQMKDYGGLYEFQLGVNALKKGFYVRKIGFDPTLHPGEYLHLNYTQDQIFKDLVRRMLMKKEKIKKFVKNYGKRPTGWGELLTNLKGEIEFLDNGGILEVRIPEFKDLEEIIKKDNIPILSIDRKILYGGGIGERLHFVIVNNIDKGKVIIENPTKGEEIYETFKLMLALWYCGGSILEIGRKKNNHIE